MKEKLIETMRLAVQSSEDMQPPGVSAATSANAFAQTSVLTAGETRTPESVASPARDEQQRILDESYSIFAWLTSQLGFISTCHGPKSVICRKTELLRKHMFEWRKLLESEVPISDMLPLNTRKNASFGTYYVLTEGEPREHEMDGGL